MKENTVSFQYCDIVELKSTPETIELSIAGKLAQVQGKTTPSMMPGLQIIGNPQSDIAYNLYFEEKDIQYWVVPELVEFIDHNIGAGIEVDGKLWIKLEDNKWLDDSENKTIDAIDLESEVARHVEQMESVRKLASNELSRMILKEESIRNNQSTLAGLILGIFLIAIVLYYYLMIGN